MMSLRLIAVLLMVTCTPLVADDGRPARHEIPITGNRILIITEAVNGDRTVELVDGIPNPTWNPFDYIYCNESGFFCECAPDCQEFSNCCPNGMCSDSRQALAACANVVMNLPQCQTSHWPLGGICHNRFMRCLSHYLDSDCLPNNVQAGMNPIGLVGDPPTFPSDPPGPPQVIDRCTQYSHDQCLDQVCDQDPFCCDGRWDASCQNDYDDCTTVRGFCCAWICYQFDGEGDPWCCEVQFDSICQAGLDECYEEWNPHFED